jgi:Uma2 family endonuclease
MDPEVGSEGTWIRPRPLGWDDYVDLPDDGRRYEILDGELYVSPSPTYRHQKVSARLLVVLYNALVETGRGEVLAAPLDVELSPKDIVQPDILYISKERLGIADEHVRGAPDFTVEILSKSTRKRDRGLKAMRYAQTGVPLYWIVDPFRNTLEVYKAEGGAYRSTAVVKAPGIYESTDLPGVKVDLGALFAP